MSVVIARSVVTLVAFGESDNCEAVVARGEGRGPVTMAAPTGYA